jgi:para-aminobenzoate synthetase/4-amino-4-deoxychorismate lyase
MGFSLLETMRLEGGRIVRRDRHIARAAAAAATLGFVWDAAFVSAALEMEEQRRPEGVWRTRLLVGESGTAAVGSEPLVHDPSRVWRVGLAPEPVASNDPSLRLKTTRREVYERARSARPDLDDALLWNERGEITESTIANVVVEAGGLRVTPLLACGLLPGVFRATLLEAGEIQERVITKRDLAGATRLWLVNSLREWIPATVVR